MEVLYYISERPHTGLGYHYYIADKEITIHSSVLGFNLKEGVDDIAELLKSESSFNTGSAVYHGLTRLEVDEPTLESIIQNVKRFNIFYNTLMADVDALKLKKQT